jgi:hypothetical protein
MKDKRAVDLDDLDLGLPVAGGVFTDKTIRETAAFTAAGEMIGWIAMTR